jgi:hypothetical protein
MMTSDLSLTPVRMKAAMSIAEDRLQAKGSKA